MATATAMASSSSPSIASYWCLELAHHLLPDLPLPDLEVGFPLEDAPRGLAERIGLRRLERFLASMSISSSPLAANPDASSSSSSSFEASHSTDDVLGWLKLVGAASSISANYPLEEGNAIVCDAQKYIHDKRATLPKLCVHLLEEMNLGLRLDEKDFEMTKDATARPHYASSGIWPRERIPWKTREVEHLVGMFAYDRHNIPWKKIKDRGRGKFHKERSAADLRDKWRRIKKREM